MENWKRFSKAIDVDKLQMIQDRCAKAMGIAFVTVDYKGIPITEYSGFTPYCTLGRQVQGFGEMCAQCDAHGGLHAAITGQPYIYRCHADLVDFAVPLTLNGSFVGAVMGGQVRLSDEEERELEPILPQKTNWRRKNKALDEAYQNVGQMSYEKLESIVCVVRDMLLFMMEEGYRTAADEELEKKERELVEERAARSKLEFAAQKQELGQLQEQGSFRYLFFIMNLISHLAYEEKAAQTEAVAYDYADMMRYLSEPEHKISTLGEELGYIGALLRIQKAWLRDKLSYGVSVPERYWDTPCPYMVLQPIIELFCQGVDGAEDEVTRLDIFAEEGGDDLLVQILSSCEGFSAEDIEGKLTSTSADGQFSLYEANRSLKRTMGRRYGLSVGPRQDGRPGICVFFRLPLKRDNLLV